MAILVTGGAGFIGSHVVKELLKERYEVVVLDDLSGGFLENLSGDAIFVNGSITDERRINQLFEAHQFEYIFHCAAYAAEVLSHHIRKFNYENNMLGTVNLINAAINHDVKCFVFTSSVAVYGDNQTPFCEDLIPAPIDPYGIAKLAAELDLAAAHSFFKLPFIVYRLHNVYGEHQNISDKYRNVVGIFMNQLLRNEPMTIFGDGKQTRSFSYVKDIVPLIAKSIHNGKAYNEVFNVGSDTTVSLNELASIVSSVMGMKAKIKYLSPRHEVKQVCVSHEKMKAIFGGLEETPLESGLREMFDWIKGHGSRAPRYFRRIEISKMLPEAW